MKRQDDYETRREGVKNLNDDELKTLFWELADKMTAPMIELGRDNTTPAIERSVLLRMGFSSIEAKAIVYGCLERSLLGHGAGNIIYRLSKKKGQTIREAGLSLVENDAWDEAKALF
ncbi:MAG: ornithine aminomutase subunit alpha [Clostridia bacterium]